MTNNHEVRQFLIHWETQEGEQINTYSDEASIDRHMRWIKNRAKEGSIQIEDITNQLQKRKW